MAVYTFIALLLVSISRVQHALAATLPRGSYCMTGCNDAYYGIPLKGPADVCANELQVKAQYYCAAVYCSPAEIEPGLKYVSDYCVRYGQDPLPSFESVVSPSLDLSNIERISRAAAASRSAIDYPVIPDADFFAISYRTVVRLRR